MAKQLIAVGDNSQQFSKVETNMVLSLVTRKCHTNYHTRNERTDKREEKETNCALAMLKKMKWECETWMKRAWNEIE